MQGWTAFFLLLGVFLIVVIYVLVLLLFGGCVEFLKLLTRQCLGFLGISTPGFLAPQPEALAGRIDQAFMTNSTEVGPIDTRVVEAVVRLMEDSGREGFSEAFLCPITREVLRDPVMAADGHTYDRSAITNWFSLHRTSPLTNAPLRSRNVLPNYSVRSQIIACGEGVLKSESVLKREGEVPDA
eukprot:TRINITY_DN78056_c0_g1_i1.p1 TRINITY_DN78056_c0_g1~~TRINITY_DN78056_c0_g1_i1.p1  ORF type:complete len:184 (+),score=24.33 TRINITY_DN78056_c0_g1_i1:144-695(+)